MKLKPNEPKTQPSRYRSLLAMVLVVPGLLLGSAIVQAQPTITGIYPNGTNLFQPSAQLTFTASSAASITNVSVQLTITPISTGAPYLLGFTPGHGLTISGPATAETVSAPLATNRVYAATIQVTDGNGVSTTTNFNFDTVSPAYTFEAEDWDYTSTSSGQYIDNPQVNAYAGLASTAGSDYFNANVSGGGAPYRPKGLETEGVGDVPRLAYIGTTNIDYDIGFGHTNTWGNYTRHYPAGSYNIYMRGADGNSQDADSARISVTNGTATIAGTGPYTFSVPNVGGWQAYSYVPARDSSGKIAVITFDGTASTLQVFEDGGDMNANFYMLVPNDTNAPVIATVITNIYPDGSVQFQASSALTFTAISSNGIDPSGILVKLSGTSLQGVSFVSNLTASAGLTVGGTSTNRTVSAPLMTNTAYTAFIQVVDGSGNPVSVTVTFDTVNPSYTFEGEDWDYNSGTFADNPQTNAYNGVAAVNGIDDLVDPNNAHSFVYRGGTLLGFGLNTEPNGDKPRAAYASSSIINPATGKAYVDYDVGWNSGGDWGDYTRHYPAGTWNVYLRGANGGVNGPNGQGSGQAFLASVTSGAGTTNQTVAPLGTFTIRPTGGWQKYVFIPLLDAAGNLVQVTTTGGQQTFRVTTGGQATGGSYNANYYMFIPAQVVPITIQNLYPDGTALFQYTNQLSFNVASAAGVNTNGIAITVDGVNAPLTITGSSGNRHVVSPVMANAAHTVVIAVTNTLGDNKSVTVKFDTFQATDYTLEAEDYDYTSNGVSGQFFDNPQVDAYYDLPSTAGIDNHQQDATANPFLYRNVDTAGTLGPAPSTPLAGDLPRAQYTGTNADYNIGFFGNGSWCNYTRHYPAGSYHVWERYAEGGSSTTASTLSLVTSGYGTASQTTALLGSFVNPVESWSIYRWAPLVDASNNWVKVTFDGSRQTLQLGGTPNGTQPEVNVNFLLLAPIPAPPVLTATVSGGNIHLSFLTQSGNNYQVLFKSSLTGGTWQPLGSSIPGNGSTISVNDPVGTGTRFYRLVVQ